MQKHSDVTEAQPVLGATTALSHVIKSAGHFVLMWVSVLQLCKVAHSFFKDTHTRIILCEPGLEGGPATKSWCSGKLGRLTMPGKKSWSEILLSWSTISGICHTFWHVAEHKSNSGSGFCWLPSGIHCVWSPLSLGRSQCFSLCLCSCPGLTSDGNSASYSCLFTLLVGWGRNLKSKGENTLCVDIKMV